jgi:hypothetical protein
MDAHQDYFVNGERIFCTLCLKSATVEIVDGEAHCSVCQAQIDEEI